MSDIVREAWIEHRAEELMEKSSTLDFKDAMIQAEEDWYTREYSKIPDQVLDDDDSWREYDIDDKEEL